MRQRRFTGISLAEGSARCNAAIEEGRRRGLPQEALQAIADAVADLESLAIRHVRLAYEDGRKAGGGQ